jgi:hypothetical protein
MPFDLLNPTVSLVQPCSNTAQSPSPLGLHSIPPKLEGLQNKDSKVRTEISEDAEVKAAEQQKAGRRFKPRNGTFQA